MAALLLALASLDEFGKWDTVEQLLLTLLDMVFGRLSVLNNIDWWWWGWGWWSCWYWCWSSWWWSSPSLFNTKSPYWISSLLTYSGVLCIVIIVWQTQHCHPTHASWKPSWKKNTQITPKTKRGLKLKSRKLRRTNWNS